MKKLNNPIKIFGITSSLIVLFLYGTVQGQSEQLCQGVLGIPILFKDFGRGTSPYSNATPASFGFHTTFSQKFEGSLTNDGMFSFQNLFRDDFGVWHGGDKDHTPGDEGGYAMVVNASYSPDEFYRDTISGICAGSTYEFSAYIGNIFLPANVSRPSVSPNVRFEIRTLQGILVASYNSGPIPPTAVFEWKQYGLTFASPTSAIILLMVSDAAGGLGNDLVIDDIVLSPCLPATTSLAPISSSCENDSDTIGIHVSGNVHYSFYQWEMLRPGSSVWTNVGAPGVSPKNPENYLLQLALSGDSLLVDKAVFRVKLATSKELFTLKDPACSSIIFSETILINVLSKPIITLATIPLMFVGDAPYTVQASPAGGTFSGTDNLSGNGVITPSFPGTFSLTYLVKNNEGCMQTTTKQYTIQERPTGVKMESESDHPILTVFPNPANEVVNIELKEAGYLQKITLKNSLGVEVFQKFLHAKQETIVVSDLEKGLYYLSIESSKGIQNQKLIIQ